jgi:hypothetical protein
MKKFGRRKGEKIEVLDCGLRILDFGFKNNRSDRWKERLRGLAIFGMLE